VLDVQHACRRQRRKHLAQRLVVRSAARRAPDISLGRAELLVGCHERRVHELRPGKALRCAALVSGGLFGGLRAASQRTQDGKAGSPPLEPKQNFCIRPSDVCGTPCVTLLTLAIPALHGSAPTC